MGTNKTITQFKNSKSRKFIKNNEKTVLILFFVGGFIFDSLTLGRIDRVYDLTVLSFHITALTCALYLYNLADDQKWKETFFERYQIYLPLAIQFFFGGLSSAYVIYFSRSVSISKTISFFIILVILLLANEFLKKKISNKYLQFSLYFFVSFTFFTFMIPVIIKEMNTAVFILSGIISLVLTLSLITWIYFKSPSTREEIKLSKIISLIAVIYFIINTFYFTNLIPPVPLALKEGIVAHNVQKTKNGFEVSFEKNHWSTFWRDYNEIITLQKNDPVYVFTTIFAPTEIRKPILHRWFKFDNNNEKWLKTDEIQYEIIGGRNKGYRGYTYKENTHPGKWKVEVLTLEEQILGVLKFEIVIKPKQEVNISKSAY